MTFGQTTALWSSSCPRIWECKCVVLTTVGFEQRCCFSSKSLSARFSHRFVVVTGCCRCCLRGYCCLLLLLLLLLLTLLVLLFFLLVLLLFLLVVVVVVIVVVVDVVFVCSSSGRGVSDGCFQRSFHDACFFLLQVCVACVCSKVFFRDQFSF